MELTGTTSNISFWSEPELISTEEVGESIEMVYVETSSLTYTVYPPLPPDRRVFKIIYSCVDGKWNKSERIYGKIIAPIGEHYSFENGAHHRRK